MIDIHSHIMYGVDDGSRSLEESITLIKKAVEVGVTDLYLTPHYAPKRGFTVIQAALREKFILLKEKISQLNLPINLYLGNEIDESDDVEQLLLNNKVLTLNNSKYILLDFGMRKANIDEFVYNMIIAGYIPIIAHPERYRYVEDLSLFDAWKKTGALIQVNASNVLYPKTSDMKKKIKYLIKNNLIDYVASDAHHKESSFEDLDKSMKYLCKKGVILKDEVI